MKKVMITMVAMIVSATAIVGLSSFTTNSHADEHISSDVHTHVACQGKHCRYTVGCSCSGFSPITNGDVWEQAYCKRCNHHKRYH